MHTTTMGSDSRETMNMYLHRRRPLLRVMAYTESSLEGMQLYSLSLLNSSLRTMKV